MTPPSNPDDDPVGTVRRTVVNGKIFVKSDDYGLPVWNRVYGADNRSFHEKTAGETLLHSVVIGVVPGTPAAEPSRTRGTERPPCNCGPCQREAAARNAPIPYLRRQVAELIFDALDESQRGREVLPIHTKADVDAAAAAVVSLVQPEVDRLTAEVAMARAELVALAGEDRADASIEDLLITVGGDLKYHRTELKHALAHYETLKGDFGRVRRQAEENGQRAIDEFEARESLLAELNETRSALELAEERIAKTRQALRLDEKWAVQLGALAVRQERDRLKVALEKQQALVADIHGKIGEAALVDMTEPGSCIRRECPRPKGPHGVCLGHSCGDRIPETDIVCRLLKGHAGFWHDSGSKSWTVETADVRPMLTDESSISPPAPAPKEEAGWKSGDIALDHTNFVHRRFEHGWRVVVRTCGVQYDDESMETALGPLLRLASVPDEVDVVGAVPIDVAARLREEADRG